MVFGRFQGWRGVRGQPRQRSGLFAGMSSSARGPKVHGAVRTGSRIDAKKKRARARDASWKTPNFRSRSYTPCGHGLGRVADGWLTGGRRSRRSAWFAAAPLCLLRGGRTRLPHGCCRAAHGISAALRRVDPLLEPPVTTRAVDERASGPRAAADDAQKEGRRPGPALRS